MNSGEVQTEEPMKKSKELAIEVFGAQLKAEVFIEDDGSFSAKVHGLLVSPVQRIEPGEPVPNMKQKPHGPFKLAGNTENVPTR